MARDSRSFYRTKEFKVIAFAIVSSVIFTYGTMELLIVPDPQNAADVERPCRSSLPANYTVPAAVLNANGFMELYRSGILRRRRCRRTVINLLLFHNEVDLLEVRLRELGDAVDHFVVLESTRNFRMHKRNLLLKPLLNTPRFQPFRDSLVYDYNADYPDFPEHADPRSVRMALHRIFMDELMATFTKSFLHIDDDAWILFNSADEIPSASVVDFLSHHDGIPDVVAFGYAKSVYSFRMPHAQGLSRERTASTWRCLRDDLATSLDALRFATAQAVAEPWALGTREQPAGWHCSWCLGPAGVLAKIASEPEAINRSVDAELTERLMRTGRLYSGELVASSEPEKSRFVLPAFVKKNPGNFKNILLSMSRDQA
ncbi:beta-1,4-mannosyl-glycoprotein 4-beta-N-acetylglucosaminyltransferase-like [Dermacentor variabilis]|uniref:beta-1,4-mannosyl-glycoprotein 4-beta-N-acetylglucosaminyltransferase-like n=1 Tax=Dermacentor variabilis TaxID=34621 RepID=UPI003F5B06CB